MAIYPLDITTSETNALPEEQAFLDITSGGTSAPIAKDPKLLEEYAVKAHMALGEDSPGVETLVKEYGSIGGDERIRQMAEQKELKQRFSTVKEAFKDSSVSSDDLVNAVAGVNTGIPKYILEKRIAESTLSHLLANTNNPEEVNDGAIEPNMALYDAIAENQTIHEYAKRKLDDIRAYNQGTLPAYLIQGNTPESALSEMLRRRTQQPSASWIGWGTSQALSFIPGWDESTLITDALGEKLDKWFVGQNLSEQYAHFRGGSPETAIPLLDEIYDELMAQDARLAEVWFSGLVEGYSSRDAGMSDTFQVLNVLGSVPVTRIAKGVGKGAEAITGGLTKGARIRKATREARDYNAVVTRSAKDISESDARSGWAKGPGLAKEGSLQEAFAKGPSEALKNRLERHIIAQRMSNATVDEKLAASGYIEEASRIRALDILHRTKAGLATEGARKDFSEMLLKTTMFSNPVTHVIDMAKGHIPRANDLADMLQKQREIFDSAMSGVMNVQRLPSEVEVNALNLLEKQLELEAKQKGLEKAVLGSIEKRGSDASSINLAQAITKWGKKDGTLFSDALTAENTAKNRYGFIPGSFDIVQEGDGYAIRTITNLDETSPHVRKALINTENETRTKRNRLFGVLPVVPKSVSSAKDTVSPFQAEARATLVHAHSELERYYRQIAKPFDDLSKKELRDLKSIMEVNRNTEKIPGEPGTRGMFYSTDTELELAYLQYHKRLPTPEEIRAYFTAVHISDMDYVRRTVDLYRSKARMGIKKVEFSTEKGPVVLDGKEVDSLPFGSRQDATVFLNLGKQSKLARLSDARIATQLKKEIKDSGWKMVQVYNPEDSSLYDKLGVSGPVNFIVTPKMKTGTLRFSEQINYNPGFHVAYKDTHFIKQANISFDSTGKRVYKGDSVFLGVSNTAKGEKELALIEEARKAISSLKGKNLDDALDAVRKKGLPMTKNELKKLFKERFNPKVPFRLVRSGRPATDGLANEIGQFEDVSINPYNLARQTPVDYLGERNAPLWSIREATEENPVARIEEAPMMDVLQTEVSAMQRLIRNQHLSDYQITAAESFVQEFGVKGRNVISMDGYHPVDPQDLMRNPLYYTMNGQIIGSSLDSYVDAAKTSQTAIKNLLRHNSIIQDGYEHLRLKILSGAYKYRGEKFMYKITPMVDLFAVDIPAKARALAYHAKLGLFNVAQIALQSQSAVLMTAVSPKHGLGATMAAAMMMRTHILHDDAKFMDWMAKAVGKATPGWTRENFLESVKLLRRSGFARVSGEQSFRNDIADPKLVQTTFGKFLDLGSKPFTKTEEFVRISAWNAAYKEYLDKFPKLTGKLTDKDARTILSRAQDLSFNMTRDSHAFWQEGSLSMATQFWGYTMRMFDLLTGDRLSKGEKARLILMNAMLYGVPVAASPLLPIWPWDKSLRQYLMEQEVNTNEGAVGAFMNGLVATTVAGVTEMVSGKENRVQLDIGNRWGPQSLQLLWNVLESTRDESGLDEILKILGGASGTIISTIISDTFPVLKDAALLTSGHDADSTLLQNLNNTAKNVSSFNNLERGWQAYNIGVYKNKHGQVMDEDFSIAEAFVHGTTGIETQTITDTFLMFRSAEQQRNFENKSSDEAKVWIRRYFASDDPAEKEEYLLRAKSYLVGAGFSSDKISDIFYSVYKEEGLHKKSMEQFSRAVDDPAVQQSREIFTREMEEK